LNKGTTHTYNTRTLSLSRVQPVSRPAACRCGAPAGFNSGPPSAWLPYCRLRRTGTVGGPCSSLRWNEDGRRSPVSMTDNSKTRKLPGRERNRSKWSKKGRNDAGLAHNTARCTPLSGYRCSDNNSGDVGRPAAGTIESREGGKSRKVWPI
jgi:hypothetical protein